MSAMSGGTGIFAYIVCAGSTGGFILPIGTTCPTTSTAKTVTSIRLPHTCTISSASGSPAHPLVQNPSPRTTGRFGLQVLDPVTLNVPLYSGINSNPSCRAQRRT